MTAKRLAKPEKINKISDESFPSTGSLTDVVKVVVFRGHRITVVLGIKCNIEDLEKRHQNLTNGLTNQVAYRRYKQGKSFQEDSKDFPKFPVYVIEEPTRL